MPQPKSRQTFELPIDGFDLGFEGCVPPGRMAKLLETLRWRLARSGEHPVLGTFKAGVLRAQTLELVRDVTMGETLSVELWLSRVGRTSLEFSHSLRTADGGVVGRATCTIVAIGDAGPAPLPPGLAQLVDGESVLSPPKLEPPDPSRSYVRRFHVRPSDLDLFRHVNQSRYVDFLDDARHFARHEGHAAGFVEPVGLASVSYESELKLGQEVEALIELREDGARRFGIRRVGEPRFTTKGMIIPRNL
jgi:acyl-CoA thioesterase FadM